MIPVKDVWGLGCYDVTLLRSPTGSPADTDASMPLMLLLAEIHTHTQANVKDSKPVALCGKTTVPLCVFGHFAKGKSPLTRRDIQTEKEGTIFQTSSLELLS